MNRLLLLVVAMFQCASVSAIAHTDISVCANTLLAPRPNLEESLQRIHHVLREQEQAIKRSLEKISTSEGAQLEWETTLRDWDQVMVVDKARLAQLKSNYKKVAVFASTNFPLWNLIFQAGIVSHRADEVFLRAPDSSRDTYKQILDIFHQHHLLENISIEASSKRSHHDVFANINVMGLNVAGTQPQSAPADLIVFTGSTNNAIRLAERTQRYYHQLRQAGHQIDLPAEGQRFLVFGMGSNPSIILENASIDKTVDELVFGNATVNGGQDCNASEVIYLPRDLKETFIASWRRAVEKLGSFCLTMNRSMEPLASARNRFLEFLVNQDGLFQPESKQVGPHLFVFNRIEQAASLTQAFAPFFQVVLYDDWWELLSPLDRNASVAMGASVFGRGEPAANMIHQLRSRGYNPVLNEALVRASSLNVPAGTRGGNSSLDMRLLPNGELIINYRPIQITQLLLEDFPQINRVAWPKNFVPPSAPLTTDEGDFLPLVGESRMSLEAIKLAVSKGGLGIVLAEDMAAVQNPDQQRMFQLPIMTLRSSPKDLPLVLLHPTSLNSNVETSNKVRSKHNLLLGIGTLNQTFRSSQSKLWELGIPGAKDYFAPSGRIADWLNPQQFRQWERKRTRIFELWKGSELSAIDLSEFLKETALLIHGHFPDGAIFKGYGESATSDYGRVMTTFGTNWREIAKIALSFENDRWASEARFAEALITDPDSILIQQWLRPRQTSAGYPMEFRVDFLHGQPVLTRNRRGREFYPNEERQAAEFVGRFFSEAGSPWNHLSGGADVMQLADGSWLIVELNIGSSSGTLTPQYFPLFYHQYISTLMGRSSPWLAEVQEMCGDANVGSWLRSQTQSYPLPWKTSLDQTSAVELAHWCARQIINGNIKVPDSAGQLRLIQEALGTLPQHPSITELSDALTRQVPGTFSVRQ